MKITALMLTGESFYATTALASYETWLKDFDAFQIYSFAPCSFLPITRVGSGEGKWSCFDKRHQGLFVTWRTLAESDWFCFCSCDAYFWIKNLRDALKDVHELSGPVLLGGPHFQNDAADGTPVSYPPGGAGYCLNRLALSMLLHRLRDLRAQWKVKSNDWRAADVFMGWAASVLGFNYIEHPGFHQENPMHGIWPYQTTTEKAISYHHLSAEEIRAFRCGSKDGFWSGQSE